jgi:hypothetical protein
MWEHPALAGSQRLSAGVEAERITTEQAKWENIAAEEAEHAHLEREHIKEEERVVKQKAKEGELTRLKVERITAEKAEHEWLIAEEAEQTHTAAEEAECTPLKHEHLEEEEQLTKAKAEEECVRLEAEHITAKEAEHHCI